MLRVEIFTDVPDSELKELTDDLKDEGAKVYKKKQKNGKWAVVAVFPNENDGKP